MPGSRLILTYGTFDLLHVGHVRLLERLAHLGDRVIVGLSTDAFNAEKGKIAVYPYAHRAEILMALQYVDAVFPETCWDQKRADILRLGAAVLAMGDDWAGHFDMHGDICEVIYLPRTLGISTTATKTALATLTAAEAAARRRGADQRRGA